MTARHRRLQVKGARGSAARWRDASTPLWIRVGEVIGSAFTILALVVGVARTPLAVIGLLSGVVAVLAWFDPRSRRSLTYGLPCAMFPGALVATNAAVLFTSSGAGSSALSVGLPLLARLLPLDRQLAGPLRARGSPSQAMPAPELTALGRAMVPATMSGRRVWISAFVVWVTLWAGLVATGNAAFGAALGGLALVGCLAVSTNYRGAARWFWLQYQRSPWTRDLEIGTIQLIGRFGIVISSVVVAVSVADLMRG